MYKRIAFVSVGVLIAVSPFIVSAQSFGVGSSVPSVPANATIGQLETLIAQLTQILEQLLSSHQNQSGQPSATIDQNTLTQPSANFGIDGLTSTSNIFVELVSSSYTGPTDYSSLSNLLKGSGQYGAVGNTAYVGQKACTSTTQNCWDAGFTGVQGGSYTVYVFDGDNAPQWTLLATGTLIVGGSPYICPEFMFPACPSTGTYVPAKTDSNGCVVPGHYLCPVSQSDSLAATDPNPVPFSIVAGGTTGVTVSNFTLQPSGENMNVQQLGLYLRGGSASPQDVTQAYVYQGSTLVGTVTFAGTTLSNNCPPANSSLGAPAGGCYFATTTVSSLALQQNAQTNFIIKADIAPIGVSAPGTSGDHVVIGLSDAQAVGANSGTIVQSGYAPDLVGVRIFKSYPIVTFLPLQNQIGGTNTPTPVLRFSITASPNGSVGIYKFGMNLVASGANLSLPTFGVYTDPQFSNSVTGFTQGTNGVTYTSSSLSNGVFAGGQLSMFLGSSGLALEIPAGQTYYFQIDDTVAPTSGTFSVTSTLDGDSSYQTLINANGANVLQSNLFWTPNDNGISQFATTDWTSGDAVQGLPMNGIVQTLTGGVQSVIPSITSISPTSGAVGSQITISGANLDQAGTNAPNGANIRFNNTSNNSGANVYLSFVSISNTQVVLNVPSSLAAGTYNVYVMNNGGTSNILTFTITSAPVSSPSVTYVSNSGGSVTGSYANLPSGSLIVAINVTSNQPASGVSAAVSGSGTVTLTGLPIGTFYLKAQDSSGNYLAQSVSFTSSGNTQQPPTFTVSPMSGTAPLSVGFSSTGAPGTDIGTTVEFGDGASGTLIPAPTCFGCNEYAAVGHIYVPSGTYTATLVNSSGSNLSTATVAVSAAAPPTCAMSYNPSTVAPAQLSTFTWSSTNATSTALDTWPGGLWPSSGTITGAHSGQTLVTHGTFSGPGGTTVCSATLTVVRPTCTYSPPSATSTTITISGGVSACSAWCSSQDLESGSSIKSGCVYQDSTGTQTLSITSNPNLANALTALESALQGLQQWLGK